MANLNEIVLIKKTYIFVLNLLKGCETLSFMLLKLTKTAGMWLSKINIL